MADTTYTPKIYKKAGGDTQVVASGGNIAVESGGIVDIESGGLLKLAGTTVTATAAELNALSSLDTASFVVGAEAGGNAINVAIQLKDGAGADMAVRSSVFAYLSNDAAGDAIVTNAPSGGWAIGTDGLLIPVVTNKAAMLTSESDGDIDVTITEAGAYTCYLIIRRPNGKLVASGAITFAG